MKIFYDYEIMLFQKFGGVSRYYYEIIKKNNQKCKISVPLFSCKNYYFRDQIRYHKQYKIISSMLNELNNIINLLFHKYDIIHPTYYYAERFLKFKFIRKNAKIVVTVYDMIHELILNDNKKFLEQKKKMIQMADAIICISESTKNDLLRLIPDVSDKEIKVIYLGNSLDNNTKGVNVDLPKNYILFVGSRGHYKNFETLVSSFPLIRQCHQELKLLCAGGGKFTEEEINKFKELEIENSIIQMDLKDNELAYAYQNSKCYIFPSIYEGFGLPILEAFSCDCPVVLSNCSCFPEIAEDAALYFDGKNHQELAAMVNRILDEEKLSKELKLKGKIQLKKYSWDKCAKQTFDYYNEILKNK